jgi:hypothetical protein
MSLPGSPSSDGRGHARTSKNVVPKDALFPPYAIDYFRQLRLQYELLVERGVTPSPAVTALFARVEQDDSTTTWADVFFLETAYLYALPDERLAAEVVFFRDRYQQVADPQEYATYLATSLLDLSKATPAEVRSELLTLAERLRYLYTFVPPKEAMRNTLSRDAAILTLLLLLAAFGFAYFSKGGPPPVLIVVFAGVLGGFLSVQQRLQQTANIDPLFKELQLKAGWFGVVFLAPISGAVFALVLYWIFLSGLLEGALIPSFGLAHPPPGPIDFLEFIKESGPRGLSDYGKLLVWSFIAGFAERFVPDVLTRLTQQVSGASTNVVNATSVRTANVDATNGQAPAGGALVSAATPQPAPEKP